MKVKKLVNKIDLDDQFDVELQGCYDDCTDYYGKTSFEVNLLEGQGFNATEPSTSDTQRGLQAARDLGISWCYRLYSSKTATYW